MLCCALPCKSSGTVSATPSSWARLGSNQRPLACEASALPLSYAPGAINVAVSRSPDSAVEPRDVSDAWRQMTEGELSTAAVVERHESGRVVAYVEADDAAFLVCRRPDALAHPQIRVLVGIERVFGRRGGLTGFACHRRGG